MFIKVGVIVEWLSIVGVVVSMVGVILSLLLFNASINNGRKILLNNVLYKMTYEVLFMFSPLNNGNQRVKDYDKFNKSLISIHMMLNEISYCSTGVPGLQISTSYTDTKAIQTFNIYKTYHAVVDYLESRNIKGLEILMEYFDDRFSIMQCFNQERKYIRKWFIGPIIGIKVSATRNKPSIAFSSNLIYPIPIKKITNINDIKTYYNNVYLKFDPFLRQKTYDVERKDIDVVQEVPKGKEIPITIYR